MADAIRWLTVQETTDFAIQRGKVENGAFCVSYVASSDLASVAFQFNVPAGLTVADVMEAAQASEPGSLEYWRLSVTMPFTPSTSDYIRGRDQCHRLLEAAQERTAHTPALDAIAEAGFRPFVRMMSTEADDALPDLGIWRKDRGNKTLVLSVKRGRVTLALDDGETGERQPLMMLSLVHENGQTVIPRFWPSFMQSVDALVAIALDLATVTLPQDEMA